MKNQLNSVKRFVTCEDGPTAVEYAVVMCLIVIASLTAISGLGTSLASWFDGATTTYESLTTP